LSPSLSLLKKVDLAMMVFSWENARQLSSSFSKILVTGATLEGNRVIGKVSKTRHQNPEFCHTQGEILKNLQKSTFRGKLSFILSFLFPERLRCCHRYIHCS
jgi:hypothetical protein